MTPDDPLAALRRCGTAPDTYGPTLNTAGHAADVEIIGRALAERLRTSGATALAIWNTSDEAVLAHVVGRELAVPALWATETRGLVNLTSALDSNTRLVLLATTWHQPHRLASLRVLAETCHAQVVAVAAVIGSTALAAVTDVSISALTPERAEA
jgi:hypothetical protein